MTTNTSTNPDDFEHGEHLAPGVLEAMVIEDNVQIYRQRSEAHAQVLQIEQGPLLVIEWGVVPAQPGQTPSGWQSYLEVWDTGTVYGTREDPPESLRYELSTEEGEETGWVIERTGNEWREVPWCAWQTGGSRIDQPTPCDNHAYTADDEYCLFHRAIARRMEELAATQPEDS